MDLTLLYSLTVAFMFYIIGLVLPPIVVLLVRFTKKSNISGKIYRNKKCNICYLIKFLFTTKGNVYGRLSKALLITGIGSIFLSASSMLYVASDLQCENLIYNMLLSIFIGIWAPTLILLSHITKPKD